MQVLTGDFSPKSEWQQVSRILLIIKGDLSNLSLISHSISFFSMPLGTFPRAPVTMDFTVTFILHSFFGSMARSEYLYILLFSFIFNMTQQNSRLDNFWSSSRNLVYITKSLRILCVSFFRTDSRQIWVSRTIHSGSLFPQEANWIRKWFIIFITL